MRRFYIPPERFQSPYSLSAEERHHATVLRLLPGETVTLFDGAGREMLARLETLSKTHASLSPLENERVASLPFPVVLGHGLSKGDRSEEVIRHGTELGMTAYFPLALERSVVRLKNERAEARGERWQKIALEAIRQSRRAWLPEVRPISSLEAFCEAFSEGSAEPVSEPFRGSPGRVPCGEVASDSRRLGWVLDEEAPLEASLRQAFPPGTPPPAGGVWMLVGPEGGLTRAEVALARRHGFTPVSLGAGILRTETATLAILAIASYLWGDSSVSS